MKFLFDENLSPRLVTELSFYSPDCAHVESLGMRGSSDEAIWAYARDNDFIVVSKDDDFRSLALVGMPVSPAALGARHPRRVRIWGSGSIFSRR